MASSAVTLFTSPLSVSLTCESRSLSIMSTPLSARFGFLGGLPLWPFFHLVSKEVGHILLCSHLAAEWS